MGGSELFRRLFELSCERDLYGVLTRIFDLIVEETGAEQSAASS